MNWKHWLIILLIALVLFGTKKIRGLGTDLGAAIRGFKKAVNEGDDEQAKQLNLSLIYWLQTEAPRPDGGKGGNRGEKLS